MPFGICEVNGGLQATFVVTVEIEGQPKQALVAKSVVRRQFKQQAAGAAEER